MGEEFLNGGSADTFLPCSSVDTSVLAEDDQNVESTPKEKKKTAHNIHERKRKDKIKIGIQKIGQLLPHSYRSEKESATFLLEQASVYIKDLRDKLDQCLLQDAQEAQAEEIRRLRLENEGLRKEVNELKDMLQRGVMNADWLKPKSKEDGGSFDDSSPTGGSSKRKNIISQHLEAAKKASLSANPLGLPSDGGNGGMQFVNQLLLSPPYELNDSEPNKTASDDGDTGVEMDTESPDPQTPTSVSAPAVTPSVSQPVVVSASLSQPPMAAQTLLTSAVQPMNPALNPVGLRPPVPTVGNGPLQGTLVLHNGQLLLLPNGANNPQKPMDKAPAVPTTVAPGLRPPMLQNEGLVPSPQPPPTSVQQPTVTVNTPQGAVQMNMVPSAPNQLPSALILPNGQIVPVVTQPNLMPMQPPNAGLLTTASRMPVIGQQQAAAGLRLTSGVIQRPGVQPIQTVPSSATVRLFAPQPNSVVSVPSSAATALGTAPRPPPSVNAPQAVISARPPLVAVPPAAVDSTAKSSTNTSLSSSNLPTTVAAMLTPEGNIILTFPNQTPQTSAAAKKGTPRTLMPKPSSSPNPEQPSTSESSTPVSKAKCAKGASVTSSSSMTPLSIAITSSASSTSSATDILAKATESIFASGSPNDISPSISSFYNPVHDDNPLHIDTGGGDEQRSDAQQMPPPDSKKPLVKKANTKAKVTKPVKKKGKDIKPESAAETSMGSPPPSSFLDQLNEKEDEEADITDFSDLIQIHNSPEKASKTSSSPIKVAEVAKSESTVSDSCSSDARQSMPSTLFGALSPEPCVDEGPVRTSSPVATVAPSWPLPDMSLIVSTASITSSTTTASVSTSTGSNKVDSMTQSEASTMDSSLNTSDENIQVSSGKKKSKKKEKKEKKKKDKKRDKEKAREKEKEKNKDSGKQLTAEELYDRAIYGASNTSSAVLSDGKKDSTAPPLQAEEERKEKKSKKSKNKSKNKDKKKKHSQELSTTQELDSSSDSQKELRLLEIQNDLAAQVQDDPATDSNKKSKKTSKSKKKKPLDMPLLEPAVPLPSKDTNEGSSKKIMSVDALPDSITFSANDIADVLSQVESMGSTAPEVKKGKRPKTSSPPEAGPPAKRRKELEAEQRIRNEPPPPALAAKERTPSKSHDVFAFDEDISESSPEKVLSPLSKSRKRAKGKGTKATADLNAPVPSVKKNLESPSELFPPPPPLITDHSQADSRSPSQISPSKNLFDVLPNLLTPSVPISLDDSERCKDSLPGLEISTPAKSSVANDSAMNEAIDSLCRILPSPGKDKDSLDTPSKALSLDLEEPPTPGQARHTNIVSLARHVAPPKLHKSGNDLAMAPKKSSTDKSKALPANPKANLKQPLQQEAVKEKAKEADQHKSPVKQDAQGQQSVKNPQTNLTPATTNDVVNSFPTPPYSADLHHSPGKKSMEKSPRQTADVIPKDKDIVPVASQPSGYTPDQAPPLQHENFSCMAQAQQQQQQQRQQQQQQQQQQSFSAQQQHLNRSAPSCAVQGGKDPQDYPYSASFGMHGMQQPFSLPVTTGTNTFSFTASGSHSTTTTTSSTGYDPMRRQQQHQQQQQQQAQQNYANAMSMYAQSMAHAQQQASSAAQKPLQHMPPALGYMDTPSSKSSCSANATPRRETPSSAEKQRMGQTTPQNAQQTSPYNTYLGNTGSQQKTPTMPTQNPFQDSQSGQASGAKESCSNANYLQGANASRQKASGSTSSRSSVGRSPQPTMPQQQQQSQKDPFLSPSGAYPQSASASSMASTLTSPPLHHHGPAPQQSHRSSASGHRPNSAHQGQGQQQAQQQRANFNSSHYGMPNTHFGPISAFGAQAFDPPALNFSSAGSSSSSNTHHGYSSSAMKSSSNKNVMSSKQTSQHQSSSSSSSSKSRSSKSKKAKQQQQQASSSQAIYEMESNLFDPNRMTPWLTPLSGSPPPRNLQGDGPTYIPNLFNNAHGRTYSNSLQHKDQMGHNPFMFSGRPQNGIGLNFQAGFGMNPMHPNHTSASQLPGHSNSVSVTPHMPNFNHLNIFDMNGAAQGDGINISPIKLPHGNGLLGAQAGMEHNLQHSHQAAAAANAMYHNSRGQVHPSMLQHPIFPQHPGFEVPRGVGPSISSAMTTPFGGHAHTPFSGMPLNFPMHDH